MSKLLDSAFVVPGTSYRIGLDPILGLDDPSPDQPALAVRRLVAVLSAAFVPLGSKSVQPHEI